MFRGRKRKIPLFFRPNLTYHASDSEQQDSNQQQHVYHQHPRKRQYIYPSELEHGSHDRNWSGSRNDNQQQQCTGPTGDTQDHQVHIQDSQEQQGGARHIPESQEQRGDGRRIRDSQEQQGGPPQEQGGPPQEQVRGSSIADTDSEDCDHDVQLRVIDSESELDQK